MPGSRVSHSALALLCTGLLGLSACSGAAQTPALDHAWEETSALAQRVGNAYNEGCLERSDPQRRVPDISGKSTPCRVQYDMSQWALIKANVAKIAGE